MTADLEVDGIPSPGRTLVMGVVNVTPDSFSDGGLHATTDAAVAHALRLVEEGADVLDVGGESTRPGASPVGEEEEGRRVVPVVAALRARGIALPISVDTTKAAVARAALRAGATLVNDVSAGEADPAMLGVVAREGAGIVLMHRRGEPRTMQDAPSYDDVTAEVVAALAARARAAEAAGIPPDRVFTDPGIGFGKTFAHNETLLRDLEALVAAGRGVWVGASRKAFLGAITGRPPRERLAASLACAARAAQAGAHAVRVHDVAATKDLLRVLERIAPRHGDR
jgi:dihydropteroate synthase